MGSRKRYIITVEIIDDETEANYLYDELEIILGDLDSFAILSMETVDAE